MGIEEKGIIGSANGVKQCFERIAHGNEDVSGVRLVF